MFGDKKLFIARKIETVINDYGQEVSTFEKPQEYNFSYMPTSSQVDYQIYGELINNMFTSILPISYLGVIKSGDVAYLIDGDNPNLDELISQDLGDNYCSHANYRVKVVQPQNVRLKVIFEKIKID